MEAPRVPLVAVLILAGGALAALYVLRKGSVSAAASGAAAAAVNAAGGAARGAVGAVGAGIGLPTPDETTTDPLVARWLIDNHGYLAASQWSGAPALWEAMFMAAGSGLPPPRSSAIANAFPVTQRFNGDFWRDRNEPWHTPGFGDSDAYELRDVFSLGASP